MKMEKYIKKFKLIRYFIEEQGLSLDEVDSKIKLLDNKFSDKLTK